MNHQPFEDWLLSEGDLTPDEDRALQNHLDNCEDCTEINTAWQEVRQQFQSTPQIGPRAGFSERWEARLAEERAREQHKMVLRVLGLTAFGALASSAVLLALNWDHLPSSLDIIARLAFFFTTLIAGLQDLSLFLRVLVGSFPPLVSLGIWIAISMSLVIWIAIWFVTVWKLPFIKRSLT